MARNKTAAGGHTTSPSKSQKAKQSATIEDQIQAFFAKGGEMEIIPSAQDTASIVQMREFL